MVAVVAEVEVEVEVVATPPWPAAAVQLLFGPGLCEVPLPVGCQAAAVQLLSESGPGLREDPLPVTVAVDGAVVA